MIKRESCANHIACHGIALLSTFMIGGGLTSAVYGQSEAVPPLPTLTLTAATVAYDNPLMPRVATLTLSGTLSGATAPSSQRVTILAQKGVGVPTTLSDQVAVGADGAFSYTYNKATLDDSAPISITAQWGEVTSIATTINYPAAGNAVTVNGKQRKALVVIWDGCRGDVAAMEELTPNLHAYARLGAYSFKAFTGGIKGDPVTRSDTSTAPGFNNIWTGVFANKHKVTNNNAKDPNYTTYPTFFKQLKTLSEHKLYMVGYFGWKVMYTTWLIKEDNFIDDVRDVEDVEDTIDHQHAITMLSTNDALDLFFYEFAEPDHQGHGTGFSPTNLNYTNKVKELDVQLKELIDAVRLRPTFNTEEWILVMTSDHGGLGTGHGGQSEEERNIPFVVTPILAAGVTQGVPTLVTPYFAEQGPANCAVHPTLLAHFGYTGADAATAPYLEAKPFGLPGPWYAPGPFNVSVNNTTRQATLTWAAPTSYVDGVPWTMTITNDVDSSAISLDGAAVMKGSILLSLPLSSVTTYTMASSTTDSAGVEVSDTKTVTVTIAEQGQAPDQFSALANHAIHQVTLTWALPIPYSQGEFWTMAITENGREITTQLDIAAVMEGSITLSIPLSDSITYTIVSSATDNAGMPVSETKTLTVSTPVSDMPSSVVRDLYCYLPMEDTVNDISTRGTIITPNDATKTLFTDGPQGAGKAANFNSTWWVDVGCPAEVKTGSFSVSLWLYVSSSAAYDTSLFGTLNFASPNNNRGFAGVIGYTGGSTLSWNALARRDVSGVYQKDTWNYVTYVFNRNADRDTVTAYRNGEKVFTKLFAGGNQDNFAPHDVLLFGSSGPALDPGSSLQDEICVWKRALTDNEAKSLYHDYKGILPTAIAVNDIVSSVDGTMTLTIDRVIDRTTAATGVQTYGICYGAEDKGKTLVGWDHTSTLTFPVSTPATTVALPTGMAYYRLYVTNDLGTVYTQAYPIGAVDLSKGLTHYLPMNGTVLNMAPATTVEVEPGITVEVAPPAVTTTGTPTYHIDRTGRDWTQSIQAATFTSNWQINLGKPEAIIDGTFTLSCWMNVPTTDEYDRAFISTQNWDSPSSAKGFTLTKSWGKLPNITYTTNARYNLPAGYIFDTWTYVTYTFDNIGNTVKGYANGKEIFSSPYNLGSVNLAAYDLIIGSDGRGDFRGLFSVDEFALWNRALSPVEVFSLYNDHNGVLASSPLSSGCAVENELLTFAGSLESRLGTGAGATYGIVYDDQDQGETLEGWQGKIDAGVLQVGMRTLSYQSQLPLGTQKVFRWFIQDATTGQVSFSDLGYTSLRDEIVLLLDGDGNITNKATGEKKLADPTTGGVPPASLYVDAPDGRGSAFDLGGPWWLDAAQPPCVKTGDFTLGLWFNRQPDTASTHCFFGTQNWESGTNLGFSVHEYWANDDSRVNVGVGGVRKSATYFYAPTDNLWQYLTIVVNRTENTMVLYRDGRQVDQIAGLNHSGIARYASHIADGMALLFGRSGKNNFPSKSYQDEIVLWDRALSATEVGTLYTDYEGVLAAIIPKAPSFRSISQDPQAKGALAFNGVYRGPEQGVSYGIAYMTAPTGGAETFTTQIDLGVMPDTGALQYPSTITEDQPVSYAWYYYTTAPNATKVYSSIYTYTPDENAARTSLKNDIILYLSGDNSIENKVAEGVPNRVVPVLGDETTPQAYVDTTTEGRGSALALNGDWWVNAGQPECVKTGSFTLGLWFNKQALRAGQRANEHCFFGTQNWQSGSNLGFSVHESGLSTAWGGVGRIDVYPYYTNTVDLWQYLTIVVNRNDANKMTMKLYKDGTQFGNTLTLKDPATADAYIASDLNLLFGHSGLGNFPANSYQDEIALWSRALSAEEVSALYTTYGGVLVEPQPYYTLSIDNGATVSPEALTYLQGILRETGADPAKNHTISAIDALKVYAFTLLPVIDDASGRITAPLYHFKIVDLILTTREEGIFANATIEVAYTHAPVGADAPQLAPGCTIGLFANTAIDAATYNQVGGVATAINPVDGRATIRDVPLNGKTFFKARVLPPSN